MQDTILYMHTKFYSNILNRGTVIRIIYFYISSLNCKFNFLYLRSLKVDRKNGNNIFPHTRVQGDAFVVFAKN